MGSEGGGDLCAGRLVGLWKLVCVWGRRHVRYLGTVKK